MDLRRRDVIRAGGVGAVGLLAGCIARGPAEYTQLAVSLAEGFDTQSPMRVPVRIDATVQGLHEPAVALGGIEVRAYDVDRSLLARQYLGDVSWAGTPAEQREYTRHDSPIPFADTDVFLAERTLDASLECETVPEWLTVAVRQVWFGDVDELSEPGGTDAAGFVGRASATQPVPAFMATIRQYTGQRPPPKRLGANSYEHRRIERMNASDLPFGVDRPLLPE